MSVTPSGAKQAFLLTDKDLKTLHCVDVSTTSKDTGKKIPFLASKLLSLTSVRDAALRKWDNVENLQAEADARRRQGNCIA